ncbi:amidase family protein, partial [Bordetella pertussis]|uniref:amidase family protein n=1 Tax=Bordetella pertussis TaxID=520 RepID=UPI000B22405E
MSIPAATCGVVGLMPTRGLLPGDGVAPLAGELDTVGLLARCADDAQAVLHAALDAAQAAALDAAATPAMERWRIATCWIHPDPPGADAAVCGQRRRACAGPARAGAGAGR